MICCPTSWLAFLWLLVSILPRIRGQSSLHPQERQYDGRYVSLRSGVFDLDALPNLLHTMMSPPTPHFFAQRIDDNSMPSDAKRKFLLIAQPKTSTLPNDITLEYLANGHHLIHVDKQQLANLTNDLQRLLPFTPAMKISRFLSSCQPQQPRVSSPFEQPLPPLLSVNSSNVTSFTVFFTGYHLLPHEKAPPALHIYKEQLTNLFDNNSTASFLFNHATHRAARLDIFNATDTTIHAAIHHLAQQPDILWIDEHNTLQILNDVSAAIVQSGSIDFRSMNEQYGLSGHGEIIGTADTGLDYHHCFFQEGRLANNHSIPPTYLMDQLPSEPDVLSNHTNTSPIVAYIYWSDPMHWMVLVHGNHTSGNAHRVAPDSST